MPFFFPPYLAVKPWSRIACWLGCAAGLESHSLLCNDAFLQEEI